MRRRRAADVIGARLYEKSNVIELQLADLGAESRHSGPFVATRKPSPGRTVFLKCPQISLVEWHPFSLATVRVSVCTCMCESVCECVCAAVRNVRVRVCKHLTLCASFSLIVRPPAAGVTTLMRYKYASPETGRVSAPEDTAREDQ